MKKMNLNIIFSSLVFLLLNSFQSSAQLIQLPAFYTEQNEMVNLNDSSKAVLVVRSLISCGECFGELNNYLVKSLESVQLYSVSICDSSSLERKRMIKYLKQLMPDMYPLVDYNKSDSLQLLLTDKVTPLVFLINKDKIELITYNNIFPKGKTMVVSAFKKRFQQFLNNDR